MAIDSNYKHSELTDLIIAVFYDVYNELGFGQEGLFEVFQISVISANQW